MGRCPSSGACAHRSMLSARLTRFAGPSSPSTGSSRSDPAPDRCEGVNDALHWVGRRRETDRPDMKFTLRLVSALWLSVMLVIGVFAYLQIREERERLAGDLQRRAMLIAEGLTDAIEASSAKQSPTAIERIVKK